MASRLIQLAISTGEELFVRPEAIMAFGQGHGFPSSSWIMLWGSDCQHYIRETCQELATILNSEGTHRG